MERVDTKGFVYEFGKFVLDPREKTLFADGSAIHLPAKEFETLLLLVEHNGHALSKEQMISAIWQDAFVEEGNLVKQISRLRKIFNSNGENLIETLPKHGYRFTADLRRTLVETEQPVILEKRTVQRVSLAVEGEIEREHKQLLLPPKRQIFSRKIGFGLLALILLIGTGVVWFWQPKLSSEPASNGMVFLTNSGFDDESAYWTDKGIFYIRYLSPTQTETWQMKADGSDQNRVNYGSRSPDGTKIVFRKPGENKLSYLADENGANEIALPFVVGNNDWSPDGSQFVYQGAKDEKGISQIFLYTLATGKNINLTNNSFGSADPSFSYDGKQVAFTSFRDGNAEIYTMNIDGSNVRRITDHPAFDNYPVFSPDGTQIAYASNRKDERTQIYLQNLNNDIPPAKIADLNGNTGLISKCWSADATQILLYNDQYGKSRILLSNVEPYPARVLLSDENADLRSPHLSPGGKEILYEARLADERNEFRITNLESGTTKKIFKTEPNKMPSHSPALSPDGKRIAFSDRSGGNSEIFIINTDGTGLQNLTNDPLLDTDPVFSPDGNEIIFARDLYGAQQLYRMNLDGSDQRRVTEKNGYEMTPAVSPDGSSLVFAGDRDGRGLDIFLLALNDPNYEKRLAGRRLHDVAPAFSPDGKRIAFVSTGDGNSEIYLMNADGTGLFRLTHTKADEGAPQFSADGKKLIFAAKRDGNFAIYEIDLPF